jgi:16S rRNA A1518/A1519 N6-dimethyltransferase RsmA/KsgA/DIM1 with predicted DNA glycosylase/AP lyase activity
MGTLFNHVIKLFKDISVEVKNSKNYKRSALIEVGFGTAELFSKVDKNYDMVIGVELSQSMIDCAMGIHS